MRIRNENISISDLPSDNLELLEDDPYKEILDLSRTNMFRRLRALKNHFKKQP